jgi:DNA-directed RNA polymerase subunit RPC12/RpoP
MESMQTTPNCSTGRSLREMSMVAREARRLVGLERQYQCSKCGGEHRSWTRMRDCPDCGERLAVAVIHRAAVVGI